MTNEFLYAPTMLSTQHRPEPQRRHLLSIADASPSDLLRIVERAHQLAEHHADPIGSLDGAVVGIYFRRSSTRTRTAFSSGALRLGAKIVSFGPNDLQENTGETFKDTGLVLAGMLDGFVARTNGPISELADMAEQTTMSVINAMTEDEHPTQAIADLCTLRQLYGRLEGLRLLYMGEGNNTTAALVLALSQIPGSRIHLRTPDGYGTSPQKLHQAYINAGGVGAYVEESHDPYDLPTDIDVVYTTRWQTMGAAKPDPDWRKGFEPFRVDNRLMSRYPNARFMHDLPAHRDEEVTSDVLEGPASIAFQQAHNKMFGAMAVLEWCIRGFEKGTK